MAHVLVEKIRVFVTPDLKWRKPTLKGWLALIFVALAFVGVIAFFAPMTLGWKLIGGISMEPIMSWRSYVLFENIVDPARELEIGDIVCVDNALIGKSTKRVIEMDPERGVYVVGDNKAVSSMDSSYGPSGQEVWIPFKEVRYRVKDVLTLRRLWRTMTKKGRFQNWLDENEPPWALKLKTNDYLIYEIDGIVDIVKRHECRRLARFDGQFVDWNNGVLVYRETEKKLRRFDPLTGKNEAIKAGLTPVKAGERVELTVRNDGNTFFGPAYVLVDKSLPKGSKLRILGRTYSLRIYFELDYEKKSRKPAASFNLTPRDDSVPSGTVTATVVPG